MHSIAQKEMFYTKPTEIILFLLTSTKLNYIYTIKTYNPQRKKNDMNQQIKVLTYVHLQSKGHLSSFLAQEFFSLHCMP